MMNRLRIHRKRKIEAWTVAFVSASFWGPGFHMSAHAEVVQPPPDAVVHVVVMWFEESAETEQAQRVIDLTRTFEAIPGVLEIRVGEPVSSGEGTIDRPFSVAMYIVFESESALAGYADHPIHRRAVNSGALAGLERMETFDFVDRPGSDD